MSEASVVSRVARAALGDLQKQFEALAPKYPSLEHIYVEHHEGANLPFLAFARNAAQSSHATGVWEGGHRILLGGRWLTLRTISERPIQLWEGWFQGDGYHDFSPLAKCTGERLAAFRVRVPAPSECLEILRRRFAAF